MCKKNKQSISGFKTYTFLSMTFDSFTRHVIQISSWTFLNSLMSRTSDKKNRDKRLQRARLFHDQLTFFFMIQYRISFDFSKLCYFLVKNRNFFRKVQNLLPIKDIYQCVMIEYYKPSPSSSLQHINNTVWAVNNIFFLQRLTYSSIQRFRPLSWWLLWMPTIGSARVSSLTQSASLWWREIPSIFGGVLLKSSCFRNSNNEEEAASWSGRNKE